MIDLWLDDIRPAPDGWTWVKTVDEAKKLLETGTVRAMSLDHDLGACEACLKEALGSIMDTVPELAQEAWLEKTGYQSMPNCTHFGTGYDLVCWMEETGNWSKKVPSVHSANPVGRDKMNAGIRHHPKEIERLRPKRECRCGCYSGGCDAPGGCRCGRTCPCQE